MLFNGFFEPTPFFDFVTNIFFTMDKRKFISSTTFGTEDSIFLRSVVFILGLFIIICLRSPTYSRDAGDAFPDLENWVKSEDMREFTPENLFDYINGAADSYLSYQFNHLWVMEYSKASGAIIKAEIYEHNDENHAFGIYSIERSPEYDYKKIGGQAYRIEDILNMVCGNYYVKLHGYSLDESEHIILENLAGGIAENLDAKSELPDILHKFPVENQVENSAMYIAENFLGYDFLRNAFAAIYKKNETAYQLFIIAGKDKAECQNILENYMKFTRQDPDNIREGHMVIHDRYNGDVYVLWKNDLIFGTVECTEESACKNHLEEFESILGQ